jgi:hypothetical protein
LEKGKGAVPVPCLDDFKTQVFKKKPQEISDVLFVVCDQDLLFHGPAPQEDKRPEEM